MTADPAFDAVRRCIVEVLPDLDPSLVCPTASLHDLGANSIDRADVVTMAMEQLGVAVPVREFQGVDDIGSLVDLLRRHL